jgi:hypothetical protein
MDFDLMTWVPLRRSVAEISMFCIDVVERSEKDRDSISPAVPDPLISAMVLFSGRGEYGKCFRIDNNRVPLRDGSSLFSKHV